MGEFGRPSGKTVEQQGVATLHRLRQGWVEERTALINGLRGLLVEFGITIPQRIEALRRVPEILEDADNELPGIARRALYSRVGTPQSSQ